MTLTTCLSLLPFAMISACSADPGTRPSDMGAPAHDATARKLDTEAATAGAIDPKRADTDRKLAAEHRTASLELTREEAAACDGVPVSTRDECPIRRGEGVVEVTELLSLIDGKTEGGARMVGASVTVVETGQRTKDGMERLVACNLARTAERGEPPVQAASCPLAVHGAKATVHKTSRGLRIDIHGDDGDHAKEILRRASSLVPPKNP